MYDALNRIVDNERESEAQCKADDTDDVETLGILICIMTRELICTLKVYLLLSYDEEVNAKERCQRSRFAGVA